MNKEKYIPIHKVFENALNMLPTLSTIEKALIAQRILQLSFLDDLLERNDKDFNRRLLCQVANDIYSKSGPVDLMAFSALVYKSRERGVDPQVLIDAMNCNGEWLIGEMTRQK